MFFQKKKNLFSMIVLAAVLFLMPAFMGCDDDNDDDHVSLVGYWASDYGDGFEIDTDVYPYEFYSYIDSDKNIAFWGYIVNDVDFSSSDCYITVLVKGNDGVAAGSPNYGNNDMTVDSFTVARVKNYSGKTCSEASSPYKSGEVRVLETQLAAETEFTDANGYFDYPGEYTKQ